VNAEALLHKRQQAFNADTPFMEVMLLQSGLTLPGHGRVAGACLPGQTAVVSVFRFAHMKPPSRDACFKTAVMQEVGHLLGLIPPTRRHDVEEAGGVRYCTNRCVMRHGQAVATWQVMTYQRLRDKPLCRTCASDLWKLGKNTGS
jgi:predicted Zn-dependent protease